MISQTTDAAVALPLDYASPASRSINPWMFVPVLYFMQAVPNVLVTETFGTAYKSLGIDNVQITLWTGLAVLPWVFKMFWAPLVDLSFTKRKWTIAMQFTLTATFVVTALVMTASLFFALSVGAMFLIATLSATHDIACDGLYLMSLDRRRQAAFSGVMATCSRLGRLFDVSVIVFIAGWFVGHQIGKQSAWALALAAAALVYGAGAIWNFFALPRPAVDVPAVAVPPGERRANIVRTLTIIAFGVALYYFIDAAMQWIGYLIYLHVPAGKVPAIWDMPGTQKRNLTIQLFVCAIILPPIWLLIRRQVRNTPMGDAFASYFRQSGFGAIFLFIVFYRFGEAMIFAMAKLFFLDTPDKGGMGISLEKLSAIQGVGQVGGLVIGGLLGGYFISRVGLRRAFWPLVVCMHVPNLLYIWASNEPTWAAAQTLHIPDWPLILTLLIAVSMTIWLIAAWRRSVPKAPMIIVCATVAAYIVARSFFAPVSQIHQWQNMRLESWPAYLIAFAEAFGYGFGFAGYFVYLMHVAQRGKFTTSHYAIGTGLGALFITFAMILAGIVQQVFGYLGVFVAACLFTIPGTLTLLFIPLDHAAPQQGVSSGAGH